MTEPDQMTATRPACLAISGSGRSGTTILSVLLSQDAGVLNIGQLRDILAGWQTDVPCTCGQTVNCCPVWGALRHRIFADAPSEHLTQTDHAMRQFMAEAAALSDWNDRSELDRLARTHDGFLNTLAHMLRALIDLSNARLLVDSSKSPEFALACHLSGAVDLYVLNLVRDPRAVACSWAKKKPGRITKQLDAWGKRQRRLARWQDAAQLHHKSLSYEAFTMAPQAALRAVLAWVHEDLPPNLFTDARTAQVSWANQHLFPPSNETVLAEMRRTVTVRAPRDWRAARHWPLHLRALTRSFPQGPAHVLGLGHSDRRLLP